MQHYNIKKKLLAIVLKDFWFSAPHIFSHPLKPNFRTGQEAKFCCEFVQCSLLIQIWLRHAVWRHGISLRMLLLCQFFYSLTLTGTGEWWNESTILNTLVYARQLLCFQYVWPQGCMLHHDLIWSDLHKSQHCRCTASSSCIPFPPSWSRSLWWC